MGKVWKTQRIKRFSCFCQWKIRKSLKYLELFYDLHLLGWSPIYTYDHRGQGFSQRSLPPEAEGFIENYSHYKKDLKTFLSVVKKDKNLNKDSVFLIAFSMGATISLEYLKDSNKRMFQAAVLVDPMTDLQAPLLKISQQSHLTGLKTLCRLTDCQMFFPSLRGQKQYKLFTNSSHRFAFSKHITKQYPQAKPKGTSLRWIVESLVATKNLKQIHKIQTPLLFLQATQTQIISHASQNSLCLKLGDCCSLKRIEGQHELFLEKDIARNQTIESMLNFFSNSSLHQKCKNPKSVF